MEDEKTEEIITVTEQKVAPTQVVKTTRSVVEPAVKTEPPQEKYESKKTIFRAYQVIWYILGFVESLLILRIVLKALGADPLSGFVYLVFAVSEPLAMPFTGMFRNLTENQNMFEWGTIIGCFVYLGLAYGLMQIFQLVKPTNPKEVEENV